MLNDILPEFQKFLAERKFAASERIPFYALWVSKFLTYSNKNQDKNLQARIAMFIDLLSKEKQLPDWQIEQASNAVGLYLDHFLSGDSSSLSPEVQKGSEMKRTDCHKILHELREAIRLKHYAYSTERSYLDWSRRFFAYIEETKKGSREDGLDEKQVRDFLSHLAVRHRVSSATQNQAFNALLFLFREVLKIELKDLGKTVRAKRGPKLPVVLTTDEMRKIIVQLEEKDRLLVHVLYGTGMRLMELARLRVKDVDFGLNSIIVKASKGDKDRVTMMPEAVKAALHEHLVQVKKTHEADLAKGFGEVYLPDGLERKYPHAAKDWGWQYVFPATSLSVDPRTGKVRRHHISPSTIQKIVATAVRKAGIAKHATVHTLRHSFATHLLMQGVNIREIQELLGHKNVETTMIYTHVVRNMSKAPESPLDSLLRQATEK